ncbi:hypothetical protein C0J52_20373 [Blattella germanica]|nr:hypothetical protein C0J52_20373 [Blattella germanica]
MKTRRHDASHQTVTQLPTTIVITLLLESSVNLNEYLPLTPEDRKITHFYKLHAVVANIIVSSVFSIISVRSKIIVFSISRDEKLYFSELYRKDIELKLSSAEVQLDLDYLERRGDHARAPRGPPPEAEASPDSMDLVKVILLGAPAVGKTSIIQTSDDTGIDHFNNDDLMHKAVSLNNKNLQMIIFRPWRTLTILKKCITRYEPTSDMRKKRKRNIATKLSISLGHCAISNPSSQRKWNNKRALSRLKRRTILVDGRLKQLSLNFDDVYYRVERAEEEFAFEIALKRGFWGGMGSGFETSVFSSISINNSDVFTNVKRIRFIAKKESLSYGYEIQIPLICKLSKTTILLINVLCSTYVDEFLKFNVEDGLFTLEEVVKSKVDKMAISNAISWNQFPSTRIMYTRSIVITMLSFLYKRIAPLAGKHVTKSNYQEPIDFQLSSGEIFPVFIRPSDTQFITVRIFNLPPEILNSTLQNVLSQYGTVQEIRNEKWSSQYMLPVNNGIRAVKIDMKKKHTSFINCSNIYSNSKLSWPNSHLF